MLTLHILTNGTYGYSPNEKLNLSQTNVQRTLFDMYDSQSNFYWQYLLSVAACTIPTGDTDLSL